jgi:hypothetical protein
MSAPAAASRCAPSALSLIAAERIELFGEGAQAADRSSQPVGVDACELVEGASLGRRAEEALMVVLAVDVDQGGGQLGQGCDRHHAPVYPGA